MAKYLLVFLFSFLIFSTLQSQSGKDKTWILGYGSGLPLQWNTDLLGGSFINFTDSTYQTEKFDIIGGAVTSVANDEHGNLLFYANGCSIYNKNHEIMENGDNINPNNPYPEDCTKSKYDLNLLSGSVLIQTPNKQNEYILLHIGFKLGYLNYFLLLDQLFEVKIDLAENNGLGKVVSKNNPIITSDSLQDQIVATKHANGRDWWIIIPRGTEREFLKILITPSGVQEPVLQKLDFQPAFKKISGNDLDYNLEYEIEKSYGQSCISPDGSIFCRVQRGFSDVEIYDFDRCTGNLTFRKSFPMPLKTLYLNDNNQSEFAGCCISPNNRYLYFNNSDNLYQFDLCKSNSKNSTFEHIAEWDKFLDGSLDQIHGFATNFSQMRNMPNGEICISTVSTTRFLHIIHEPNKAGKFCIFEQRGLELPRYNSLSLNYFPNFNLYDLQGSICDSIGIDDPNKQPWEQGNNLKIFPNPTTDWFKIYLPNCKGGDLKIFDVAGRLIQKVGLTEDLETYTIDVSGLYAAVYMITVKTCNGNETVKLVKL
jgi:hypothetical protein